MSTEIFRRNMDFLKERYADIYDFLKDYNDIEEKVIISESVKGEKIIGIKKDGHIYCLNSRYNDDEYSNNWIDNYKNIKHQEIFLIYGVSNFECVKKLVDKVDGKNIIMLYEPDINIFYNTIRIIDIINILNDKNVMLCISGVNEPIFQGFIIQVINYLNLRLLNYCAMPNYAFLYPDKWRDMINDIKMQFSSVVVARNTCLFYSSEFINNELDNCKDMIEQYALNQLRNNFKNCEKIDEMVAIIVAAGPSLNKNIKELKKVKDRACIIAVDTALKALLNNNIRPHLVITIDAHKPPILFAHKDFFDIPMVVCGVSNSKLRYLHDGKRIYFNVGSDYLHSLYKMEDGEKMQLLETGGSVANNAFSLAHILGFKKIILVGQDLAYPGKVGHVNDAYMGTEEKIDFEDKRYFEVEDIYGNKVFTEGNMNLYRVWFEQQIKRYPYLKVIDATEGGAKINGTEIMTLKEVVERECIYAFDKELINKIEKIDKYCEIKDFEKELLGEDGKLEGLRRKIQVGIRKYEKLEELFRKNKISSKEFKKVMEEIEDITKEIETESIMSIITLYNKAEEYEVLGNVNDVKDNLKEEIKDIVKKGTKVLNSYKKGIDSLLNDLKRRKEFDREKYQELLEELKDNIKTMEKENCENNFLNVNNLMKVFMVLALELIDSQYKINSDNYNASVKVLKNIIVEFTDKKYDNMINIMKLDFIEAVSDLSKE